jgi:hypothetical protein
MKTDAECLTWPLPIDGEKARNPKHRTIWGITGIAGLIGCVGAGASGLLGGNPPWAAPAAYASVAVFAVGSLAWVAHLVGHDGRVRITPAQVHWKRRLRDAAGARDNIAFPVDQLTTFSVAEPVYEYAYTGWKVLSFRTAEGFKTKAIVIHPVVDLEELRGLCADRLGLTEEQEPDGPFDVRDEKDEMGFTAECVGDYATWVFKGPADAMFSLAEAIEEVSARTPGPPGTLPVGDALGGVVVAVGAAQDASPWGIVGRPEDLGELAEEIRKNASACTTEAGFTIDEWDMPLREWRLTFEITPPDDPT